MTKRHQSCADCVNFYFLLFHTTSENKQRGRRVTRVQLESLWVFLSCHKNIAVGINKTLEDRERFRRLWMRVAKNINGLDGGGVRDWKGWAKYWVDYKAKLKRRASQNKKIRLTDLERKFITLLNYKADHSEIVNPMLNVDIAGSSQCNNDLQDSSSLDGFEEIKNTMQSNTMEKLVDVLKDIHKTLVQIEQKLPTTLYNEIKSGNDMASMNASSYTL